jgi:hypothetical protein
MRMSWMVMKVEKAPAWNTRFKWLNRLVSLVAKVACQTCYCNAIY